MFAMNKKGQVGVGAVPGFVWALVQVGIFVGIGLLILAKFRDTSSNATVNTSIDTTIGAVDDIPTWLAILVVMIMAGIVVSLIQIFRSR